MILKHRIKTAQRVNGEIKGEKLIPKWTKKQRIGWWGTKKKRTKGRRFIDSKRERERLVHGITNHRKAVRDEFSTKTSRNSLKKSVFYSLQARGESNS